MVHPYCPAPVVFGGQQQRRVIAVRMRASELRALTEEVLAGDGEEEEEEGRIGRAILDGCTAGRWTWTSS